MTDKKEKKNSLFSVFLKKVSSCRLMSALKDRVEKLKLKKETPL